MTIFDWLLLVFVFALVALVIYALHIGHKAQYQKPEGVEIVRWEIIFRETGQRIVSTSKEDFADRWINSTSKPNLYSKVKLVGYFRKEG